MKTIAWDIETAPLPHASLTERQLRRHDIMVTEERARHPHVSEAEASAKVRSLHPMLGWICCIAVIIDDDVEQTKNEMTFTAASPEEERDLLVAFRDAMQAFRGLETWVTFNGKRFDVEWLVHRALYHGVRLSNARMLSRNPWRHTEHCDLASVYKTTAGLADLCEHLGVPTPKDGPVTGATVAQAVADGRLDEVAAYCLADVRGTLQCYTRIRRLAGASLL